MFFNQSPIEVKLDVEITAVLDEMSKTTNKESKEYESIVTRFNTLMELRDKSKISNETIATIAANFLGLVVVMNHERAHVIATKAFGFVKKLF